MKKSMISRPAFTVVGISFRTSNQAEFNPETAQIAGAVQRYFSQQLAEKIPFRQNPGVTLLLYTDYETDHTGMYTWWIGEEVSEVGALPEGVSSFVVPAQSYAKFTTEPGPMPQVVHDAWQEIWQMTEVEFGGPRGYQTDFELYDERASDPTHQKVVLDLYIGVSLS